MIKTTHPIKNVIAEQGYGIILAEDIPLSQDMQQAWQAICAEYPTLPPDEFLPEGGKYRFRRYDSFYFFPETGDLALLPHEDYFQSDDINEVTGGIVRKFAPLTESTVHNLFLRDLIRLDFEQFPLADPAMRYGAWQVDVHQMFVKTQATDGIAHPTPEGVHRDGADFVTVHIAALNNANGGIVTVYDDDKQPLESFQLQNLLDSYLFNDAILWHGVTPIYSRDGINPAERGILTFDYHYKPDLQRP